MKQLPRALSTLCVAAPAARAQSRLAVCGISDAGLLADRDSGRSSTKGERGQQSGSRLGLRGSEGLGGGISAIFNVASFISADTGQLVFANRICGFQSWDAARNQILVGPYDFSLPDCGERGRRCPQLDVAGCAA